MKIACRLEGFDQGRQTTDRNAPSTEKSPKFKEKYSRAGREEEDHPPTRQHPNTGVDPSIFRQFQDGLKGCLSQMSAYQMEMEDLRRRVFEEEQERRALPHPMGFKETTFPLLYGTNRRKNPARRPRQDNGNQTSKGASGPAKSANPKNAKAHTEWRGCGLCHRCGEEGHWIKNVRIVIREIRIHRPSSYLERLCSSNRQLELSTSHVFSSLGNGEEDDLPYTLLEGEAGSIKPVGYRM